MGAINPTPLQGFAAITDSLLKDRKFTKNISTIKTILLTYQRLIDYTLNLRDFTLLFLRLILAYGFLDPALSKLRNPAAIADWFASMGYPFPTLNAYLSGITEISGVILLTIGFAVRFISLPLIIIMIVAIATVHWNNGFAAGENGLKIPLYFMLMLFTLVVYGSGKISLDHLIGKWLKH